MQSRRCIIAIISSPLINQAVHGGILSRKNESDMADMESHSLTFVRVVVCNLYPFESTVSRPDVTVGEAVENIDIGGLLNSDLLSFLKE